MDASKVTTASAAVVDEIESKGLSSWIDIVRKHHSQTYQHCLLVTGVAAAFGQHLGLAMADRNRLSFAGMLHDVGKAMVPVAILEKPRRSRCRRNGDHEEASGIRDRGAEKRRRPAAGDDRYRRRIITNTLTGPGYPHGLQANEIADLVRITTIVDVYSALIEQRAYRPPMSSQKAYDILREMGPKLDKDLVRAFGFVTKLA